MALFSARKRCMIPVRPEIKKPPEQPGGFSEGFLPSATGTF
jgi:hypothetical protein